MIVSANADGPTLRRFSHECRMAGILAPPGFPHG
jgi:hypothetical protein